MTTFHTSSSIGGPLSDLDGFSLGEDNLFARPMFQGGSDDFGFDPPTIPNTLKLHQTYTPPGTSQSPSTMWPTSHNQPKEEISPLSPSNMELDRLIAQSLPDASSALSRYGQVTPPRSNSESSEPTKTHIGTAKSNASERRGKRTNKTSTKESDSVETTSTNKKRRNTRKSSVSTTGNQEEDDKRRQSLEKNRLAAAKCRVNKKEKTEQLQRDSHDKAVHNAFLREQLMQMKEEVQQMNALLLNHANCEGCKSPEDIQKHLSNLGNEFFAHQMSSVSPNNFDNYTSLSMEMRHLEDTQMMQDNYFSQHDPHSAMLNPPLPEFDREADFDLQTPMHID